MESVGERGGVELPILPPIDLAVDTASPDVGNDLAIIGAVPDEMNCLIIERRIRGDRLDEGEGSSSDAE